MNIYKPISALLFAWLSAPVYAEGWAPLSEHDQMRNYFIADVGEVSQVRPPHNKKWSEDIYELNGNCFYFPGHRGYVGYENKSALLLVNAQKIIKLALIESSIGSIKTELESVTLVECPSSVFPPSGDSEEQQRWLRKRREERQQMLEEFDRRLKNAE